MFKKSRMIFSAVVIFLFLFAFILNSTDYGRIEGIVVDNSGNPLPGVTVILTGKKIKTQKTFTNSNGEFVFLRLEPGNYMLKFELKGFKTTIRKGIVLVEGKKVNLKIKMKMGKIEEEIVVAGKSEVRDKKVPKASVYAEESRRMRHQALPTMTSSYQRFNTEEYDRIYENRFLASLDNPLSTFSIDVDTASYANVRRFLNRNQLPPEDAVRIEEMINYFDYDYPIPTGKHPFSVITEISECPWNESHKLAHIGIQGKEIKKIPPSNLVFLLDVSGSMRSPHKLPLLKDAFKLLVEKLDKRDKVAIVVYAGAAGLVLDSTPGTEKQKIIAAIEKLRAGGSTAGGAGIKLAYKTAMQNFIKDGNNRVVLATDGDFNVGVSSTSELVRMIEEKREKGIFLTVLGFGTGNYKDSRMENIADKGNGNYYYIDGILEAKKVLVNEMRATLFTIAKDVKIQVEFNPAKIKAYRLIGYENRMLKKEDFKDDTKDAGELGAGHTVTALYELIPYGSKEKIADIDELKYQEKKIKPEAFKSKESMTVKLRYKPPEKNKSILIKEPVIDRSKKLSKASNNFKFSVAVAEFGMLLRDSKYKANSSFNEVLKLAREAKGKDHFGYRAEFVKLVEIAQLKKK